MHDARSHESNGGAVSWLNPTGTFSGWLTGYYTGIKTRLGSASIQNGIQAYDSNQNELVHDAGFFDPSSAIGGTTSYFTYDKAKRQIEFVDRSIKRKVFNKGDYYESYALTLDDDNITSLSNLLLMPVKGNVGADGKFEKYPFIKSQDGRVFMIDVQTEVGGGSGARYYYFALNIAKPP